MEDQQDPGPSLSDDEFEHELLQSMEQEVTASCSRDEELARALQAEEYGHESEQMLRSSASAGR